MSTSAGRCPLLTHFWNINCYFIHVGNIFFPLFNNSEKQCEISLYFDTVKHFTFVCYLWSRTEQVDTSGCMWKNLERKVFSRFIKMICRMYPPVQHPHKWTRGLSVEVRFPWTLCSSMQSPPPRPPARLRFTQSSECLHNFLPTLKLSLCLFGAKTLVVMDLFMQSISKIDRSLAPRWPFLTQKSLSPIPWA